MKGDWNAFDIWQLNNMIDLSNMRETDTMKLSDKYGTVIFECLGIEARHRVDYLSTEKKYHVIHKPSGVGIHMTDWATQKYQFPIEEKGEPSVFTFKSGMRFIRGRIATENWELRPVRESSYTAKQKEDFANAIVIQVRDHEGGFMDKAIELKKPKIVGVQFLATSEDSAYYNNKVYYFRVWPDLGELEEDAVVVCQVHDSAYTIGRVVEPADRVGQHRVADKYIFQRVDTVLNESINTNRARIAELSTALKTRVAEIQRQKVIDDIVANDPEGKALLDELKSLGAF
jgi:hypothetical protein